MLVYGTLIINKYALQTLNFKTNRLSLNVGSIPTLSTKFYVYRLMIKDPKEQEYKMKVLQSMKVRLETHDLQLPQYVHELHDLYLGTYQNQLEFWTDEDCKIQRLHVYPEEDLLLVDEQVLIDRMDYAIFKGTLLW